MRDTQPDLRADVAAMRLWRRRVVATCAGVTPHTDDPRGSNGGESGHTDLRAPWTVALVMMMVVMMIMMAMMAMMATDDG